MNCRTPGAVSAGRTTGHDEDAFRAVEALERELNATPDDPELRRRLGPAIEASTVVARSLTRDQRLVLTSRRQLGARLKDGPRVMDLSPECFPGRPVVPAITGISAHSTG